MRKSRSYLAIILLLFAWHDNKHQGHLLRVVIFTNKRIDGQQLGEWMANKLKGSVNVPRFRPAQVVKLFIRRKHQVATAVDV